jgi:membrane fusion protein (multidrug efflux system)
MQTAPTTSTLTTSTPTVPTTPTPTPTPAPTSNSAAAAPPSSLAPTPQPSESQADTQPDAPQRSRGSAVKKILLAAILLALMCAGGYFGYKFYAFSSTHEETDDAYVTAHLHQVSSRINGTVEKVLVDDNDHVKSGQLLVALDPRDYEVRVEQAAAELETAERQAHVADISIDLAKTTAEGQDTNASGSIKNAEAQIVRAVEAVGEAEANVKSMRSNFEAKKAEVERAELDYNRYANLEKQRAVTTSARDGAKRDFVVASENCSSAQEAITQSVSRLEQAKASVQTARAQLIQAQGQKKLAQASSVQTAVNQRQFTTTLASVTKAQAALKEARLNLSYVNLTAPTSGRVGKKSVEVGQRIEPGQPLMTIVSDELWVVANFKETQLKKMNPGQKVDMTIDSFPTHVFEGRVQSFSPGSGASFAVLPSDNATGNFTKIVQRIPVKIIFDKASLKGYENKLAPGMSVVTTVSLN